MTSDRPQAEAARRFYDRIARVYDALSDSSEHEAREKGIEALELGGRETVLEIGVGTGHAVVDVARALQSHDGDGGRVLGLDVSPEMIELARKRALEADVAERVDLRVADALEVELDSAAYDRAFLSFTLELFDAETRERLLERLHAWLRPGGRLVVVAMHDDGRHSVPVEIYRFLHRHFPHIVDCHPIDSPTEIAGAGFELALDQRLSIWGLPVAVVAAVR